MKFRTHLISGVFCYLFSDQYLHFKNPVVILGLFLLLSIIPDIDLHSSYIGKQIPGFSFVFEVLLGHRGIVHSMWPVFILFPLLYPYGFAITISAFIVHLFLDTMTKKGIAWLWPFLRIKGPFETGRIMDSFLFYSLFSISVFMVFLRYA
jgi:membrane-bound metal-dependent hydrolase YbcI (DUF457 family)